MNLLSKIAAPPIVGTLLALGTFKIAPAQAAQFTLDFESDPAGNVLDAIALDTHAPGERTEIGDIWNSIGIDIRVEGTSQPLGLFNSNCLPSGGTSENGFTTPCDDGQNNGDPDLATGTGAYGSISYDTPPQGNLLILEENPGDGRPDDSAGGGTIIFDFDENVVISVVLEELVFVDDAEGEVTVSFPDGTAQTEAFQATQENQLLLFNGFEQRSLDSFQISFDGSGGVGAVVFSEYQTEPQAVPEGNPLLGLFLTGGLFGILKLRKKQAAKI